MKRELRIAALLVSLCVAPVLAEESKRELGAHEHGHSALNIAIEGDRVEMELVAPGADIVGFEHAAESDEDKATVERAEAALGQPLSLFGFPDAAGCSVENASVEIEGEEHHDEHADEAHAEDEHHEDGEHAEADEGEASHNEFHATYALTCSAPDALDGIDFAAFFDAFAGAEEVEVTVISEKGQSSYEVERDASMVDLQRLM